MEKDFQHRMSFMPTEVSRSRNKHTKRRGEKMDSDGRKIENSSFFSPTSSFSYGPKSLVQFDFYGQIHLLD